MGQAALKLVANDPDECRRAKSRFRVLISAKLVTTTDEHPVKLRDLSATGAKLEGTDLPPAGTDVILQRGALDVFGTIVWREGRLCGIHFEEPLTETEMLEQMHQPAARAASPPPEDYRRPGFRSASLTPEEMAAARQWAMPTGRHAYRD